MTLNIPTPTPEQLRHMLPKEANAMDRIVVTEQLKALGIEYRLIRTKTELIIEIPTTRDFVMRIKATDLGPGRYMEFFTFVNIKPTRLPGGRMIPGTVKETIRASVEFISHGEHDDVTFTLHEQSLKNLIEGAIDALSQIDGITVTPLLKKRGLKKRNNPNQLPLED